MALAEVHRILVTRFPAERWLHLMAQNSARWDRGPKHSFELPSRVLDTGRDNQPRRS